MAVLFMMILNKPSMPYEQSHSHILHEVSVPVSQMFGWWAVWIYSQGQPGWQAKVKNSL